MQKNDRNIGLQEKRRFFRRQWAKSLKNVIITSTPGVKNTILICFERKNGGFHENPLAETADNIVCRQNRTKKLDLCKKWQTL
jgi:hypothetical protein